MSDDKPRIDPAALVMTYILIAEILVGLGIYFGFTM